ncbi:MAG: T9SS type A sorting domain-containing protein [Saprospiraceae bacterium]|nr:T9SS type A sorting domain-containing protein [Saprospiraceae bacterium]
MNWRKRLLPFLLVAIAFRLSAQLQDGSVAPDFIAQDILGQTHHLYDILDSGKIVVIEISATWCAPCWVYHSSDALQKLYDTHGPAGDDKLRVFWVEGDPNTNLNCLYGPNGCNGGSAGNFVAGTTYPILDNTAIANAFQITYYPSIFVICPNKRTFQVDPLNADGLWEKARQCPVAFGANNAGIFQHDPGTELSELCGVQELAPNFALTNLGNLPLTAASIELKWDNITVQTLQWSGYLSTYDEAHIYFADQSLSNAGILKTTITNINNGTGDDDFSNNVHNNIFTLAQQFNSAQVLLKIRTDNYGEETYWEVRDDLGTVLEHGGNQNVGPNGGGAYPLGTPIGPGSYPNLALIRDTLELPANGCYSIHFSDGYGDGMCCDFGTGYYRLFNLDNPGTPLISGGEFENYSRRAFGAGVLSAVTDLEQIGDIQLFPNPASDFLNIEIGAGSGAEISGQIFNTLGQLQHSISAEKSAYGGNEWHLPVSGWPEGVYFLQMKIGSGTVTKRFSVSK